MKPTPKTIRTAKIPPLPRDLDLHVIARKRELNTIPKQYLSQAYLRQRNVFGQTVFHEAAAEGSLEQIPLALLTTKNLMNCNADGKRVLGIAASHGYLNQVPSEVLTLENLLKNDQVGVSAIHHAAISGNLATNTRKVFNGRNRFSFPDQS